jgi:hypothetical protein
MLRLLRNIILLAAGLLPAHLCLSQNLITENKLPGSFNLADAVIYVDSNDFVLVKKATALLQSDMEMVTGIKPTIINQLNKPYKNIIVIGTAGSKKNVQHKKIGW